MLTFSLKYMTLRKITIDISVRYVKKSEQRRENKPFMMKIKKQSEQNKPVPGGGKPNTRKENKTISQKSKKFLKNVAASGFAVLKLIFNCYFY